MPYPSLESAKLNGLSWEGALRFSGIWAGLPVWPPVKSFAGLSESPTTANGDDCGLGAPNGLGGGESDGSRVVPNGLGAVLSDSEDPEPKIPLELIVLGWLVHGEKTDSPDVLGRIFTGAEHDRP